MKKLTSILKCLGLLSCFSIAASAQQTQVDLSSSCLDVFTVRVNQSQIERGIDAYASAWIPVEVRRDIDSLGCGDELLISSGGDLNWLLESGTQKLAVEPYDSRRNPLHIAPSGAGWLFKLSSGSAQDMFWLRVMTPALSSPGSYFGYIELSEATHGLRPTGANLVASTQFTYEVEPSVSLSFEGSWGSGGGTYFSVDMGDLTAGSSKDFDMVLHSNTDVSVEVSSENKGYLKHEVNGDQRISYSLNIQSMPVNLTATSSLPLNFEGNYTNWRIPVLLSVPAADRTMLAGNYVDTIFVDVFPR